MQQVIMSRKCNGHILSKQAVTEPRFYSDLILVSNLCYFNQGDVGVRKFVMMVVTALGRISFSRSVRRPICFPYS
uniref:Uncharacterized protein n=1 Tax=Anopheles funestus TaxID=62324 RepID=A0A182S285_ANOFN